MRLLRLARLLPLLAALAALASGGAYKSTKHADPKNGARRDPNRAAGACTQCHVEHGKWGGSSDRSGKALFAPNDNALCGSCHSAASSLEIYQGSIAYSASSHAKSPSAIWPGPSPIGRPSSDAGKCVNCHTPHGATDSNGVIPSMTFAREERLCLQCHRGTAASDEASLFRKSFRHPVELSGIHGDDESARPEKFARRNRHAECVDCHNPHAAQADPAPPSAPEASNRIRGVGRVAVNNGAPGSIPLYRWVGPEDTSFVNEYELCFKCHSSWTTLPAGKSDLALLLNPANASYHPVEQAGRNSIPAAAFVGDWTRSSVVYCSDCHGSDDPKPAPRGPHGSRYQYILKARNPAQSGGGVLPTDLCFTCHSYDTYANPVGPADALRASRFNPPSAASGHAFHVGNQGQTCWSCHETHGSVMQPALISTTRVPGNVAYAQSPTGGSCTPSCHKSAGVRTYTANYGR